MKELLIVIITAILLAGCNLSGSDDSVDFGSCPYVFNGEFGSVEEYSNPDLYRYLFRVEGTHSWQEVYHESLFQLQEEVTYKVCVDGIRSYGEYTVPYMGGYDEV